MSIPPDVTAIGIWVAGAGFAVNAGVKIYSLLGTNGKKKKCIDDPMLQAMCQGTSIFRYGVGKEHEQQEKTMKSVLDELREQTKILNVHSTSLATIARNGSSKEK